MTLWCVSRSLKRKERDPLLRTIGPKNTYQKWKRTVVKREFFKEEMCMNRKKAL